MATLDPGTLNRRIMIQTQSNMQDGYGQASQAWTSAHTCWASIDVQNSQLIYATAEFMSKVAYRITCRWTRSFAFQPSQRIMWTEPATNITHTYEIQAVLNPKASNEVVILMAYELGGSE